MGSRWSLNSLKNRTAGVGRGQSLESSLKNRPVCVDGGRRQSLESSLKNRPVCVDGGRGQSLESSLKTRPVRGS